MLEFWEFWWRLKYLEDGQQNDIGTYISACLSCIGQVKYDPYVLFSESPRRYISHSVKC